MTEAIVDYIELPATDLAATKAFYAEAFGWEWVDYGPTYAATQSATVEIALNAEATPSPAHADDEQNAIGPLVLLRTADLASTEATVRTARGTIVSSTYAYPGGRRFHVADPSGNVIGVYQPNQ